MNSYIIVLDSERAYYYIAKQNRQTDTFECMNARYVTKEEAEKVLAYINSFSDIINDET